MSHTTWANTLAKKMRSLLTGKHENDMPGEGFKAPDQPSLHQDPREIASNFKKIGDAALMRRDFVNAYNNYKQAIACDPSYANPHNNLAVTYLTFGYGSYDEALVAARRCITLDPSIGQAYQNLAYLLLLKGEYKSGWDMYEKRLAFAQSGNTAAQRNMKLAIDYFGEAKYLRALDQIRGKKLLVWAEQGLGDFLMGCRYLPELKELGCTELTILPMPEMSTLCLHQDGVDRVIIDPSEIKPQDLDFHCSVMSLFFLFYDHTPANKHSTAFPYLQRPEIKEQLLLPDAHGKPRVGIAWHGNPENDLDYMRSISNEQVKMLFDVRKVSWISLQKNESQSQDSALFAAVLDRRWINICKNLEDTAQLISQLDLVITVDTSIAHLAGALGKTTWLLNRYQSEWRWGLDSDRTDWYPSIVILRQKALYDWPELLDRVTQRLDAEFAPSNSNQH